MGKLYSGHDQFGHDQCFRMHIHHQQSPTSPWPESLLCKKEDPTPRLA